MDDHLGIYIIVTLLLCFVNFLQFLHCVGTDLKIMLTKINKQDVSKEVNQW